MISTLKEKKSTKGNVLLHCIIEWNPTLIMRREPLVLYALNLDLLWFCDENMHIRRCILIFNCKNHNYKFLTQQMCDC